MYSWSLAFVVGFGGLLFLMASGGFFRAFVRSCPFAFVFLPRPPETCVISCLCPLAVWYFRCDEVSLCLELGVSEHGPRVGWIEDTTEDPPETDTLVDCPAWFPDGSAGV